MLRRSISRLAALVTADDIASKLRSSSALQPVQKLVVKDTSAGCGSFFNIHITSPAFQGKSLIQQHRMVNAILKDEIKAVHGFTLSTSAGDDASREAH